MTTAATAAPDPERLRTLAAAEEPRTGVGRIYGLRGAEGVTELLFVRHAQMPPSTNTAEDMPLTEMGREQAEVLAAYLAQHLPLSAVYASPLRRTQETATPVAAAQGLPVITLPGLREIETYIPGGLSLRDYLGEEQFLQMQQRVLRERTWDARGELYEGSAAFRERVCAAVEHAIAENRGGRVALVTHGPVINAYLASILQSPIDFLFQPKLTSITVVLARDDLRNLAVVNSTPHFGAL